MISEDEVIEMLEMFGDVIEMQNSSDHFIGTLSVQVGSGVGELKYTRFSFFIDQNESIEKAFKEILMNLFHSGVHHGSKLKAEEIKIALGIF